MLYKLLSEPWFVSTCTMAVEIGDELIYLFEFSEGEKPNNDVKLLYFIYIV